MVREEDQDDGVGPGTDPGQDETWVSFDPLGCRLTQSGGSCSVHCKRSIRSFLRFKHEVSSVVTFVIFCPNVTLSRNFFFFFSFFFLLSDPTVFLINRNNILT